VTKQRNEAGHLVMMIKFIIVAWSCRDSSAIRNLICNEVTMYWWVGGEEILQLLSHVVKEHEH
jgi:hypothetical protein